MGLISNNNYYMGNTVCQFQLNQKSTPSNNIVALQLSPAQLTPINTENLYQCEPSSPFYEKHQKFLQNFSSQAVLQVCVSNIFNEDINLQEKIPVSDEPKFLSSLSSPQVNYQGIMEKIFANVKTPSKRTSLLDYVNVYTQKIQVPRQKSHHQLTINKEIFYQIKETPVEQYYLLEKKIGEGSFGSVYRAKCKKTGETKAIKVLKKKFMSPEDQSKMLAEVRILKKLDHINIIKLDNIFFHNHYYYIVMEFCEGGTLLDALASKKISSQRDISRIMMQVLSAVSYIHQFKIAHLDLKLENIVLVQQIENKNIDQCVKIIDFGLAQKSDKYLNNQCSRVGTLSYMAPQIFDHKFSCHSDIWSCGIILCLLLTGSNPFKKRNPKETISNILTKNINISGNQWKRVSDEAKNLILGMLKKSPQKRLLLSKILSSSWFKIQEKNHHVEDNNFMQKIETYYRTNNFQNFIKNYLIAKGITQAEREQLAIVFSKLDRDHSGFLQLQELMALYGEVKGVSITKQMQQPIKKQMKKVDDNKSGRIDFQQFLMVMTDIETMKNREYLDEAFDYFDKDRTGYIEREQLIECFGNQQQVVELMSLIDWNGDGKVSRKQFIEYIQRNISK